MPINNQPTIIPRTISGIFTKYIAKTLPLAFDESMSYYECLCALLEYINETVVPDINNIDAGLSELQTFYIQLQSYVNNYFDNLDVQEEINNKLDAMVTDGTLTTLISNYVDPIYQAYENEINTEVTRVANSVDTLTRKLSTSRKFDNEIKIIAHRGYDLIAPENSIPAFTYVAKVGSYWGCETDLQRTYDGKFIIMHDDTIDRTTNGTGRVDELLYSTIQNLRIDTGPYIEDYTSDELIIPSLEDYLDIMKKYEIVPVMEIKPEWDSEILEDLVDVVKSKGLLYNSIFSCYYQSTCQALRGLDEEITIQLLMDDYTENKRDFCAEYNIDMAVNTSILTTAIKETAHSLGLKICEFMSYAASDGVDYLISNDITRDRTRNQVYQGIYVSKWEMDQIKKYGTAYNGQLATFIRRGTSTGELGFPKYFQSTNSQYVTCYNLIPTTRDYYFYVQCPEGYDVNIYTFSIIPVPGNPYASGWITGDGTEKIHANTTYNRDGYTILMFRRTDLENMNYKDIEFLRANVKVVQRIKTTVTL